MKKTLLFVVGLASTITTFAQSKLFVVLKDGSEIEYAIKNVDSLRFEKALPDSILNGHIYVDLGLPSGTCWAKENLGTDSVNTVGTYFAWAETASKESFFTSSAAAYGKDFATLLDEGIVNSDSLLTAEHDAATVNWGAGWRMPSRADFQELIEYCTFTVNEAAKGMDVVGRNGKSIFLPFAGNIFETQMYVLGTEGRIWASTACTNTKGSGWILSFTDKGEVKLIADPQSGRSIRPVYTPEQINN